MKLFNLCIVLFSLAAWAGIASASVAGSVEKYNSLEAKIVGEQHDKLLSAKKLLVTELTKDRADAMKAGNLKEANLADEVLTKTNSEIAAMSKSSATAPAPVAPAPSKLLLIFHDHKELDYAIDSCKAYSLDYDVMNAFDTKRTDYAAYGTIISGSNDLKPWASVLKDDPTASRPLDRFITNGGHFIAFGTWQGQALSPLNAYGIKNGPHGCEDFAPVPGLTKLLVKGNEDLVPKNHKLTCTGSIICSVPHDALLLRADDQGVAANGRNSQGMITLVHGKGRVTFSAVEPINEGNLWLLRATISWVSRGCPMK
jgi:hypothetical protein